MRRKRIFAAIRIILFMLVLILVTGPEWPAFQDERHKINTILGQRHFDFLVWELEALSTKAEAALAGGHTFLPEETRKQTVLDYLELLGEIRRMESTIANVYANPDVDDPETETFDLQREVDEKRAILSDRKPIVEAILQEQVSSVLVEEGFDILNSAWPPVEMHMTPLPYVLIVSPREEIRQIHNITLENGLSSALREEIEETVYDKTDRAALVVSIGGLGIIPSMIFESSDINYLADVVSHEWTHHWLTLHPVGINYNASPALRTINETIASIVGEEVGKLVIERYYPEFAPPPAAESPSASESDENIDQFDLSDALRETRVRVDELLAQGKVDEAEEYMEARREYIWDNGYRIRKINQAFFAFYGAYADTPGEQGDDPIGPALLALRDDSGSLREFLERVSPITSVDDLITEAGGLDSGSSGY
ncbi:MAG: hypothetical protein ACK2T3_03205 [Candidatus Promineifilaceae bacterium]